MIRKKWIAACMMMGFLLVAGCQNQSNEAAQNKSENINAGEFDKDTEETQDPVTRDVFAMDTYMSVTAYGEGASEAVTQAVSEIERLDNLLSTGDEGSEISSLNRQGGGEVSEDTAYLLERSLELWKDTGGRFEIGIFPLMKAWGFTSGDYAVPSEESIKQALSLADSSKIVLDARQFSVSFEEDEMEIDLGGIAKGYTSGKIMDIFRANGVTSGMVSLGGNVQVLGKKPDGSPWRVAIQSPSGGEEYLGVLETEDRAVITSGGYERYFEENGVTYHHIIDPSTGYPAQSGLASVTIVSPDGTLADGLSTSLFIMGREEAEKFWRQHSEEFEAILLDDEGRLYVTEGIASQFTGNSKVHIIEKDD